jgi:hypothetical protein
MAPYSPPSGGRAGKLHLDFNENTVGLEARARSIEVRLSKFAGCSGTAGWWHRLQPVAVLWPIKEDEDTNGRPNGFNDVGRVFNGEVRNLRQHDAGTRFSLREGRVYVT